MLFRSVVDYGIALVIVGFIQTLLLKAQATVFQVAETVIEVFVDAASVDDAFGDVLQLVAVRCVVNACAHFDAFQQRIYQPVVPSHRDALIGVVEIVVVESKTERDALDDESRQLRGGTPPLLFGIALDKTAIDVPAAKFQGLLFEVTGRLDVGE